MHNPTYEHIIESCISKHHTSNILIPTLVAFYIYSACSKIFILLLYINNTTMHHTSYTESKCRVITQPLQSVYLHISNILTHILASMFRYFKHCNLYYLLCLHSY